MRRLAKLYLKILTGGALLFALYIGIQMLTGNFHEVIPGNFYRSAQLDASDIVHYQHNYGIKTILNLRGANPGSPWYEEEVQTSKDLGVKHIDFKMSAARELTNEQAMELIGVMRDAPKPLLIHCRSGADRTGLASALYVAAVAKQGEWAAERQLWLSYGHLSLYFNGSYAMNRTFERLEPYLGYHGS